MVGSKAAAIVADDDEQFDTQAIIRLAAWGVCAIVSVVVAVFAARSELGSKRLSAALIAIASPPGEAQSVSAANLLVRTANAEREARRAAETVIAISADRERMAARVNAVEREVNEINGSVSRAIAIATESKTVPPVLMSSVVMLASQKNPAPAGWTLQNSQPAATPPIELAPPAAPSQSPAAGRPDPGPGQIAAMPTTVPLPRPLPITVQASAPPTAAPAPQAAIPPAAKPDETAALFTGSIGASTSADPPSAKVEFGVDLGPALTVGRLRSRWSKLSKERPELVQGLRPLISIRDTGPGKPVELRLVVGPFANVNAAIDLCSALGSATAPQYVCRPAVFDGQRLNVQ